MRASHWTGLALAVSLLAFATGTQLDVAQPLPVAPVARTDASPQQASCGDGRCQPPEDCDTCPSDCGSCCGDGRCAPPEDCNSCPTDCGSCCGDGRCAPPEDCNTCPDDCGGC
ncbi:MAG: hypothetical protein AB8I08_27025 [Sandaracinaceae bacterium]